MLPFELQSELASAPLADESSNSQSSSSLFQLFKNKRTQSQTSSDLTSLPTTLQDLFKEAPKEKSELTSLFEKQPAKELSSVNNTSGNVSNIVMPDADFITKKVKLDHSGMSPSTQDECNDDCRSPKTQISNSKEVQLRTYAAAPKKTIYKNKNVENLNKNLKDRKILQVASKKEDTKYQTDQLVFKVECDIQQQSSKEVRYMDRQEILKEDPMLLVYFYESHLQFAKAKDFCSATLKKLQV